jgi:hypothetical protein
MYTCVANKNGVLSSAHSRGSFQQFDYLEKLVWERTNVNNLAPPSVTNKKVCNVNTRPKVMTEVLTEKGKRIQVSVCTTI